VVIFPNRQLPCPDGYTVQTWLLMERNCLNQNIGVQEVIFCQRDGEAHKARGVFSQITVTWVDSAPAGVKLPCPRRCRSFLAEILNTIITLRLSYPSCLPLFSPVQTEGFRAASVGEGFSSSFSQFDVRQTCLNSLAGPHIAVPWKSFCLSLT
jgi:hypothetical protein